MSKENKMNKETEEVVDAKPTETTLATVETTAVSTEVQVHGAQIEFPFLRIGQGMSQWKSDGKKPILGGWYLGRSKDSNLLVAGMGKDNGVFGIVLHKLDGFKEDRKWQAGLGAPRRWIISGVKEDGAPITENDALEAAAKEGFTLAPRPTGEVWADTGRPKMRANLGRFCYLYMLIPLPQDVDSDDYRVFPIGDKLYTPARYEFDRQYYKQMNNILSNIRSRAEFAHRMDKGYKWSINGLVVHLYSAEATNRDGIEFITSNFEKALRDGKPWEFTDEEKSDFAKFMMAAQAGTTNVDEAMTDSEF